MRKLLTSVAAIAVAGLAAYGTLRAANLPLVSGINNLDPSTEQAIINALIQSINTGVTGNFAFAPGLTGSQGLTTQNSFTLPNQPFSLVVSPTNGAMATIVTGQLTQAGQGYRARCAGQTAANSDTKTMALMIGSAVVSTPAITLLNTNWDLELEWRAATTPVTASYVWFGRAFASTSSGTVATITAMQLLANGTDTATPDNNALQGVPIRCTYLQGTASAGDTTMTSFSVEQLR